MENAPVAQLLARAAAGLAALAGAWLILSPWILPGPYPATGRWNDLAVGTIVIALMGLKGLSPDIGWISWAGIAIGLWALFSPWILLHAGHVIALRNEVITATGIILASSIAALATMYRIGPPQILRERATSAH